jgi:hypothetical protein
VDDFAVKYVGKHHDNHLRDTLLQSHELTTDWERKVYSGMYLKWYYKNRTCDISMPGYASNVLSKFQNDAPKHPQHTPSRYVTPVYGAKTQYATQDEPPPLTAKQCIKIQKVTGSVLYYARAKTQYATQDETPPLTAKQCLNIQKVTGSVLYYARAVDPTVLMPLNDIATEQTKATEKTQAATNQLLDYLATHPDSTIRYHDITHSQ